MVLRRAISTHRTRTTFGLTLALLAAMLRTPTSSGEVTAAPDTRPAATTVSGMVGYWPFDEGQGNAAGNALRQHTDLFGSSGAAMVLDPRWVEGKSGTALDFGAGRSAVLVDKTKELNCEGQVSLSAWVKLGDPKGRGMVVSHEYSYRLCVNQGGKRKVRFQLNLDGDWAGNWLVGNTALEPGRWYHLAAVYDGRERRIYVDGTLDASAPARGSLAEGRSFLLGAQGVKASAKRVFEEGQEVTHTIAEPLGGTLDEVKVWNRALSEAEVRQAANEGRDAVLAQLPSERELDFHAVRVVSRLGENTDFEVAAFNSGQARFEGNVSAVVRDAEGAEAHRASHPLVVDSRGLQTLAVPFRAKAPGTYSLSVETDGTQLSETMLYVLAPDRRQPQGEPELRRVLSVDLTDDLALEDFCDDGASRVIDSALGRYREAGPKKHSRFVARLPLQRTGLHLVRVTYPDDKARTCEIATWSPVEGDRYNAHTGYFTGGDFPLSGKRQMFEFVMWARDVNQALVFTSWLADQPAAASRIEVFEVDGRLPSRPASASGSRRLIGHYWEDAQPLSRCFGGGAPEAADLDRVARNLCDYFDYTGQNLLMHPVVWYEGPIYNSLVEARGGKGGFHLPTAAWVDVLLERFEERGFKFYGLFNVHELPSLRRDMNADMDRIRAGEPTFNAVSKDNAAFLKTWHHRASMFNGLHPRVQERVLALVGEIATRYSRSPAFAGIGFHLTLAQLLQPGALEVSYDDWTVSQFEADTRVRVPIPTDDPDRFGKRYEWIMDNARGKWIGWRCQRTADYYGRVAQVLRSKRNDLQLVITLLEPPMAIIDPQREAWLAGKRIIDLAREGGIDPVLLSKHPGVVIQQRLGPTAKQKRLTFGTTRGRLGSPPPTAESIAAVRSMDFAEEQQRELRTKPDFGVFLYNRYFESAVGRQKPLESDWYTGIPWRASAVVPAHDHFMEYYAHSLAMLDPSFLAVGGFTNGTVGHESRVERFARVYRELPVGEWTDLTGAGEDVVARMIEDGGTRYVYVVNRTAQSRRAVLKQPAGLQPIGDSPSLTANGDDSVVELGPYQLGAWRGKRTG